jgi:DNA helicase-2/ATP-dependent DNA helicase PcrA
MTGKQQQLEKFNEIYKGLNEQQRIAVDTIEGPVMVIAGPGTGKTQILSARIGKILIDTDTQPENILCLTYTDAGVVAMRKRATWFYRT